MISYDIEAGVLPEPTAGPFTRADGDALACWEVGPDTVWLRHDGFVLSHVRDRLPADPVAFSFAVVAAHAYRFREPEHYIRPDLSHFRKRLDEAGHDEWCPQAEFALDRCTCGGAS